jgi:hypothetical protein
MESTFLKIEREYFVESNIVELGVTEKVANKIIEAYNRFIQKALLGDSPHVAEDLRRTILKTGENVDAKQ